MKRKLLAIVTSVLLVCAMLPLGAASVSAETYGDYRYTVSDGEVTITGCDLEVSGDLTIPAVIVGYPVTTIGRDAFWMCDSLTSVTIPDSVTTIEEYAFSACDSLVSIYIPDSVTTIGHRAVAGGASLTNISVDKNNPNYSSFDGVLFNKDYTVLITCPKGKSGSYAIHGNVTTVATEAFTDCDALTWITIPAATTTIEYQAFSGCDALTKISVHEENPNYSSENGVLFNKGKTVLIQYPNANGAVYTIPDSVITIGKRAFSGCGSLTTVIIPDNVITIEEDAFATCYSLTTAIIGDGVVTIEDFAFAECVRLTTITIPDSVTSIGDDAFYYCLSLVAIFVDTNNSAYSSLDGVLFNKDKTHLILCPNAKSGVYTMPDSVTTIGDGAFTECRSLTTVTIGDRVSVIGDGAFWNCSLTSVFIPGSVSVIGYGAFSTGTLTDVYYGGSEIRKQQIAIDSHNDDLLNATWHYTVVYGDVSGDGAVNSRDLALLQQYTADWDVIIDEVAADVNANGSVNARDVALLQQYIAGWDVELGK